MCYGREQERAREHARMDEDTLLNKKELKRHNKRESDPWVEQRNGTKPIERGVDL